MMVKRSIDDIDFNCIVCTDLIVEPVSLECGHTFCMECVQRNIHKKCPVCRCSYKKAKIQKNLLLSAILETMYNNQYTQRQERITYLKRYDESERYDSLRDIIIDIITDGVEIVREDDVAQNQEDAPRQFPKFLVTFDDIVNAVYKLEDNKKFDYNVIEIKYCVFDLLKNKNILNIKQFYIVNGEEWILDTINKYQKYLDNEHILFMMGSIIKSCIDCDLGRVIKNRCKDSTARDMDKDKIDTELFDLIKAKKIDV